MAKKIVGSLLLFSLISFCFPYSLLAADTTQSLDLENLTVYSNEFPNAYFEVEELPMLRSSGDGKPIFSVAATVYYEEIFDTVDGQVITSDSRLLSLPEVNAIGKENFEDNGSQISPMFGPLPTHSQVRGKLTVVFNGLEYSVGRYQLALRASWDNVGGLIISGEENPGYGDDYFGFAWGGGYDLEHSPSTRPLFNNLGERKGDTYVAKIEPNVGVVWSYFEGFYDNAHMLEYIPNVSGGQDIVKNTLTGGGNTTTFVAQYIHTYTRMNGSIGFSVGASGVGASFSLSNVDKQWTIALAMTGMPY